MPLEVFSNGPSSDQLCITVDVQGRIYLNKGVRVELGTDGLPIKLYLAYDKVNKRIGLGKPDVVRVTDATPFRFSGKRAYASARTFLKYYDLYPNETPEKYVFDGRENGWLTFRKAGYVAPDDYKKAAQEED